jgi:hypothetical protein
VLFSAIAISLACGGSSGGGTTATAVVSGTINDADLNAKGLFKSGDTLTAVVTNLDNTAQTWVVTVNADRTYSATITASINVKIEVKNGDTIILSKVLDKDSVVGAVKSVEINAVTHVEAEMVISNYSPTGTAPLLTALKAIRKEMFGVDTAPNYALNTALANLSTDNDFAATVNTYAQMIGTLAASQASELKALGATFKVATRVAFATQVKTYIQASDTTRLNIFTTAQSGAEKRGFIPAANFATLTTNFQVINPKFQEALERNSVLVPVFGTAPDSVRNAAPGVLFQYTFPPAKTASGLAITSIVYTGAWTSAAKPAGISSSPSSTSPVFKFIASQSDVGNTYKYTMTATAANGQVLTKTIDVKVTSVGLAQGRAFSLSDTGFTYYKPTLGPISGGKYFYVVAKVSSDTKYAIQKYRKADFKVGSLSLADSQNLPAGFSPTNMVVAGDYGYLTSNNSGLTSINLANLGSSQIATPAAFTGTQLAVAQGTVYGLDVTSNSAVVKYATLRSSATTSALTLSTLGTGQVSNPSRIGSYNDYLYLADANSGVFTSAVAGTAWTNAFTATSYNFLHDQSGIMGAPFYLASDYTDSSVAVTLSSLQPMTSTMTGRSTVATTSAPKMGRYAKAINGNYEYGINDLSSAFAYSLAGSVNSATVTGSTAPVSFVNATNLSGMIVNMPEGLTTGDARSGGHYMVLGQTGTSMINTASATMTGTWKVKSFDIRAAAQ